MTNRTREPNIQPLTLGDLWDARGKSIHPLFPEDEAMATVVEKEGDALKKAGIKVPNPNSSMGG